MVSNLDNIDVKQNPCLNRGCVIELIGVAGVGKSTLYRSLKSRNYPWLICDQVLPVWNISSVPFFIKNITSMMPLLMQTEIMGERLLKRREIAFLALLHGWHKTLRKKADHQGSAIILDQGPISMMAYLSVFGPESLKYDHVQSWWDSIYHKWAQALDLLVYLDTKDEVIIDRIRNRSQDHFLKKETTDVICEWIYKYRGLYTQILNRFESNGRKVKVVRIDSGLNSVDELIKDLLPRIEINCIPPYE
jgi:thymidylate kinase